MKGIFTSIKSYVLLHKILSFVVLLVVVFGGNYLYKKITSTTGDTRYVLSKVEKSTIVSSISGSGQVSSSNQIEIKSKASGDVVLVKAENGQQLKNGALIAQLDTKDAQKIVRDKEIDLASSKIALEKLKNQKSLENMNTDLAKAYEDGFASVSDTFLDLPDIINNLNNQLNATELSDGAARLSGSLALKYRNQAVDDYSKAQVAFEINRSNYRKLTQNSPKSDIDSIINETYATTKLLSDATKSMRNFVDFIAEDTGKISNFTSYQNTLSTYTNTLDTDLSKLYTSKTTIKDNKDSFIDGDLDIQSATLSVQQKMNALQDAKDKLADYSIRAPFDGVLAGFTLKRADSVSSGGTIATILAAGQNADISMNEVDVAKISIGQKATLTFDAVSDLTLTGEVSEIDSLGTVSQGVVTYNVKINFDTTDVRVKPGMSVSAAIITDTKQDVLSVPNSSIKSKNGSSYVEIFPSSLPVSADRITGVISKIPPTRIPVTTGISNDTRTEITSGLNEGDEVVSRTILPSANATTTASPSLFGGGGTRAASGSTRAPTR